MLIVHFNGKRKLGSDNTKGEVVLELESYYTGISLHCGLPKHESAAKARNQLPRTRIKIHKLTVSVLVGTYFIICLAHLVIEDRGSLFTSVTRLVI